MSRFIGITSVPQTHPPGNGWRDWMYSCCDRDGGPYRHHLIEAWRREWQQVEVLRMSDLHPATNVAGLYWRPVQPPSPPLTR